MRAQQRISALVRKAIVAGLVLGSSVMLVAFVHRDGGARVGTQMQEKIEATIFTYDGHDFVRTKTTLMTQDGKSAVNTKLDRNTPAFKALVKKRSYSGEATVFGRKYDANYAPLTSANGKLTGALFVAVEK